MVNIYYPKTGETPETRENYLSLYQSSTSNVLGAVFGQVASENPISSTARYFEIKAAKQRGTVLTQQEYEASEYYRPGVDVGPEGMSDAALKIIAENYDDREYRKAIVATGPQGVGIGAAKFGVGLVASALDPVNIAAGFIPVVGQARFAAMVARNGKTLARAKRGAAEGAFGAAIVEPVIMLAANEEQNLDYTISDSLLNVAFGTILGGGLHVGMGKVGDKITRTRVETRIAALETSVSQTIENKVVNVSPVLDADPNLRNDPAITGGAQTPPQFVSPAFAEPQVVRKGNRTPTVLRAATGAEKAPKNLLQFVRAQGGIRADDKNVGDINDKTLISKKARRKRGKKGEGARLGPEPKFMDDMQTAAAEEGYFGPPGEDGYLPDLSVSDFIRALDEGESNFGDVDYELRLETAIKARDEAARLGIDYRGLSDKDFDTLLTRAQELEKQAGLTPETVPEGMTEDEFFNLRQQVIETEGRDIDIEEFEARFDGMPDADELPPADLNVAELSRIDAENEALLDDIRFLQEEGAVADDYINEIAAYEALEAKADAGYEKGLRAAQNCLMR